MNPNSNSARRILDAALELFSAKGYEAASIREICACARITRPTLYYFYKSKEGVHRAVAKRAMSEFHAQVEQGLAAGGDLRARCKRLARVFFADAARRPKLWRFIYGMVWSADSKVVQELHESYLDMSGHIVSALQQAIDAGEVTPGDVNARVLVMMGSVSEAVENFLIFGQPKLTPKFADAIMDAVFDGWDRG
jgi:AcrR family transcriptional regulator